MSLSIRYVVRLLPGICSEVCKGQHLIKTVTDSDQQGALPRVCSHLLHRQHPPPRLSLVSGAMCSDLNRSLSLS